MLSHWGVTLLDRDRDVWPCWGRYDIFGGSGSLASGFGDFKCSSQVQCLFLLPADLEVELKCFLYKSCHAYGIFSRQ